MNIKLLTAVKGNRIDEVAALLARVVVGKRAAFEALVEAVRCGQPQMLPVLAPYCTVASNQSSALAVAAFEGQVECLKFLLPLTNPKTNNHRALSMACGQGHLECARWLSDGADRRVLMDNVIVAGQRRHTEIVQHLLTCFEPTSQERVHMLHKMIEAYWGDPHDRDYSASVDLVYNLCSFEELQQVAKNVQHSDGHFWRRYAADRARVEIAQALPEVVARRAAKM